MVYAHVIGKGYEYRLKDWFLKQGWRAERNPLSGASSQIEEELGKHDVRAWREDLKIFLQIECKKTNHETSIDVKKEWIEKIDFTNDEFLVFSYLRCQQHFAFMTKEQAEPIVQKLKLKLSEEYEPSGETLFGFKRAWVEGKQDQVYVVKFLDRTWYTLDLETYITTREKLKIPTKSNSLSEQVKSITSITDLNKLKDEQGSNWKTKDWRMFYSKLERLESGDTTYNPEFIKEGQWWLSEEKKFKWDESTVNSITEKVLDFIDKNLEESPESGENVWMNNIQIEVLEKNVKKILGLEKKNDNKNSK